jgi:hypothetical protein
MRACERIQLWRGFSPLRLLKVLFITDESMWGGSNYGEGSVRSGRSRYSLSLMRALGARIQLWQGFSPLRPLKVLFITVESTLGESNYGEGSVRSGRSRYSLSLMRALGARIQLWREFSPLRVLQVQFITEKSTWGADPTMARVQSARPLQVQK